MADIVVVGAGLAGLSAARRLAASGHDVHVVEKRATVGGRVRSAKKDGFVLDRGFQVLFTAYPAARRELDFDALDLREFTPGATIARRGNTSVLADPLRDPRSLPATLSNPNARLTDDLRVVRLERELARKDRSEILAGAESEREDTTIVSYLARRGFSKRFVETFFAPFYGGITLDRSLTSSKAVFEYTFKTLAEGEIAVPADGMGAITAQLASRARTAGARITTERIVEGISASDGDVTIDLGSETLTAEAAVVATDPPTARELTGVAGIPTEAVGCVTQYYSLPAADHPNTGTRLVLNARDALPNEVVPLSRVAPEYAPSGRELLSATFLPEEPGTPPAPPATATDEADDSTHEVIGASDAELADATRRALSAWYPGHRFDRLTLLHTDRLPFAQFAQPPGFRRSLPSADAPEGSVYLAGEYLGWSSINAALDGGRSAANAVLADL